MGGEERNGGAYEDAKSRDEKGEHELGPAVGNVATTTRAAHEASAKEPKRSEPIPATSPTLSPTLSAMVAGIVLGNTRNDLAGKIGANIGGLGVDSASDAAEHGNGRPAGVRIQRCTRRGP